MAIQTNIKGFVHFKKTDIFVNKAVIQSLAKFCYVLHEIQVIWSSILVNQLGGSMFS